MKVRLRHDGNTTGEDVIVEGDGELECSPSGELAKHEAGDVLDGVVLEQPPQRGMKSSFGGTDDLVITPGPPQRWELLRVTPAGSVVRIRWRILR